MRVGTMTIATIIDTEFWKESQNCSSCMRFW